MSTGTIEKRLKKIFTRRKREEIVTKFISQLSRDRKTKRIIIEKIINTGKVKEISRKIERLIFKIFFDKSDDIKNIFTKIGEVHYKEGVSTSMFIRGYSILFSLIVEEILKTVEKEEYNFLISFIIKKMNTYLSIPIDTYWRTMINQILSLEKKAYKDSLTKVFNRNFLETELCKRMHEIKKACFVMIDLDNFKEINDTFGHEAGDRVLTYFANFIITNTKGKDILLRYGGDEFLLIMVDVSKVTVSKVLKEMENKFENMFIKLKKGKIRISFSFGISEYPREGKDIWKLIEVADYRLLQNKKRKKKKWENLK